MKEFNLTQSYATIEELLNSGEVAVYKEELQQSDIDKYAIVSRIGNRYDLQGEKIEKYALNPYFATTEKIAVVVEENKKEGEINIMKYAEIEALIDNEVAKAVAEVNAKHEQELATLKEQHAQELANVKYEVRAEIIAKING